MNKERDDNCVKLLMKKIGAYLYLYAEIPRIIHNQIISTQKFQLDHSWNKIELVLAVDKNLELRTVKQMHI